MSSDDDPKDLTKDIVQIGVNEEIAEKLQQEKVPTLIIELE